MRVALIVFLLALSGCATAEIDVCPTGDQSTSCKCWRGELPSSLCRNWDRFQRP